MDLVVKRQFAVGEATIGTLSIDGDFTCFTLEDAVRACKVDGKTAIPYGAYPLTLCESPRFSDRYEQRGLGRIVPLIERVPGFAGIRIHVGNSVDDTAGCVLVGTTWERNSDKIGGSVTAFKRLMSKLAPGGNSTGAGILRIRIVDEMSDMRSRMKHPGRSLFQGMQAKGPG